jgi:SAM-dependent methyltransferase
MSFNFREVYTNLFKRVRAAHNFGDEDAAKLTIGGNFALYSVLERELLIQCGLKPEHYLVDVGCGSGRLVEGLTPYLKGRYLGIEVVPEILEQCRRRLPGPNWRAELVEGVTIPEQDGVADCVCFFSVFTHLLHEQSYVYLREARRVLKPGGTIVFSFTEFALPSHWWCFEAAISEVGQNLPLYVFIERNAIEAWAARLGLEIVAFYSGDEAFIALPHPVSSDDGAVTYRERAPFGQSVCVLRKPA